MVSRCIGGSHKLHKVAALAQVSVVKEIFVIVARLGTRQKRAAKPSTIASSAARRLTLCRLRTRTTGC